MRIYEVWIEYLGENKHSELIHQSSDSDFAIRELCGFTAIYEELIREGKAKVDLTTYFNEA
jgi:hypothetical protein